MATHHADDVSNEPTGAVKGATEPTTTAADWVPESSGGTDAVEGKVVEAPEPTTVRKQSRASKK